tara:strand:+ start:244 stop:612 length:369 start_codon:yes stop_codon:yes gene_type:complete
MAATIGHLSGSTDGLPVLVAATGTAGTTIHTAINATDQIDMVHLYAANNHTASIAITIEWGVDTATSNIVVTVPADSGLLRLTPKSGLPLQNSKVVKIFAATTNVIAITGHVVRSTAAQAFN